MSGKILNANTRHYPTQGQVCDLRSHSELRNHGHITDPDGDAWCENPPPVVAVLVEGEIGDYACYVGVGLPEWVARHGDKISFEEACIHFPLGLKREKYRS